MSAEKAGLYVHFPFCRRKCPYCHFASGPMGTGNLGKWRRGLGQEADRYSDGNLEFDTLYVGGGTPSLLGPEGVRDLLDLLKARFSLRLREFTLEANPSSFNNVEASGLRMKDEPRARLSLQEAKVHPISSDDEQRLAGWAEAGVTRLSVGVQSFDDDVLDVLGRESSEAQSARFVGLARRAGFTSVGLDLMVAVPGETRCGLIKTLAGVRRSAPDHVSLYILENVEGLPFEDVLRRHLVEDDAAADAFEFMAAGLEGEGLLRYEISSFARPGHECLHNLKYWRYGPFLGLGPSAGSHIGSERWTNAPRLDDWASALGEGGDPRAEIVSLEPADAAKEALIAGLRLVAGVDARGIGDRFGIDLFARYGGEIDGLVRDGLLVRENDILRIPEERLLVSNAVLCRFA
ncbi:MAG: coproporphyrinogen-III oxidase family protein [Candidatus Aminicenantales bacterium]